MVDPYAIVNDSRKFWEIPPKPVFHHLISLLTSQEVKFSIGRKIRHSLYAISSAVGCNGVITPELILSLTDQQLSSTGLSPQRCITAKELARFSYEVKTIDDYAKINGVGQWTIKGLKILFNLDSRIILYEDKWIRKRLAELHQLPPRTVLTPIQAKDLFKPWEGYETLMSYFLWRIKPTGINRIIQRQPLTRDDFV